MSDDRLFASFHILDGPIQPDPAFAERLFETIAVDLGFRTVKRREAITRRFTEPSRAFRLAYVAAILALLLAAVIAAARRAADRVSSRTPARRSRSSDDNGCPGP